MRKMIIDRIMELLAANGAGGPGKLNSTRWQPVARRIYEHCGLDPMSRGFQQKVKTMEADRETIAALSDEDLLSMFELVNRRVYIQM